MFVYVFLRLEVNTLESEQACDGAIWQRKLESKEKSSIERETLEWKERWIERYLYMWMCVCVFKVVCLQFRAEIGSSLLDTAETAEAREVARRLAASVAPTTTNEPWKKAKMKSK